MTLDGGQFVREGLPMIVIKGAMTRHGVIVLIVSSNFDRALPLIRKEASTDLMGSSKVRLGMTKGRVMGGGYLGLIHHGLGVQETHRGQRTLPVQEILISRGRGDVLGSVNSGAFCVVQSFNHICVLLS